MGKEEGKIIINIDKAYNVNPAATVVNNTFNISSGREAADAVKEASAVNGFWGKRIISGAAAMKGEVMKLKNG